MDSTALRDAATGLLSLADQLDAEQRRAEPLLGVYRGGAPAGPDNVTGYEQWLGRPVRLTHDFTPRDDWTRITASTYQYDRWKQPGRAHLYSVAMLPGTGATIQAGATGAYDQQWTVLGQNLAAHGITDWYIRLGWEFNGRWYPWTAYGQPAAWVAYWQRIVTAVRAVPGCERVRFVWCPAYGWQSVDPATCYPGDGYVDLIGLDLYDEAWGPGNTPVTDPAQRWNLLWGGTRMVQFWIGYAKAHGKPFCLPEWGVSARPDGHGGGDDPAFVEQMHGVITDPANGLAFHGYFDYDAPDGRHCLSSADTAFPLSAARYRQLFAA